MEFKFFHNSDAIITHFEKQVIQYADPDPISIINAVPYIAVLEYGGVFVYNRRTKNRKQGVFRFDKGGVVTRERFRTIVFQPPHSMVRRSFRQISNHGIRLCRRHRPRGTADLRQMLLSMGQHGLKEIKAFTHVDEDIARQGWMIKP